MTKSYYNTTHETGVELETSERQASAQEKTVLRIFLEYQFFWGGTDLTPWNVLEQWPAADEHSPPITSVRRAMTNLTRSGHLAKVAKMKRERYGKRNHVWRLNK